MSKVACHYCGLPFRAARVEPGREYFCCPGCALASRVPVDDHGRFPVNPALVTALATGFVFFNQVLFWLLAVLLARQGSAARAGRFEAVSLALGVAVWLALTVVQWRLGARRWADGLVAALTAGLLACGWAARSPECAVAASAALTVWSARGFFKTPAESSNGG